MQELIVNDLIRLEPLRYGHAFQIFQAIDTNRKFLSPWLPFVLQTQSQEDTEHFVRTIIGDRNKTGDEVFSIFYRQNFAGLIGMKDTDQANRKTEIGYWLMESMTGRGIMTRSVKALIEYLFLVSNFNRIQLKCGVGNLASSAIPKRLGFQFEGVEREGERHQKHYIDLEIYSLLRKEFLENQ